MSRRSCSARLSALMIVAALGAASPASAIEPEALHYYYFKDRRALPIDTERIAVLPVQGGAVFDRAALAQRLGIADAGITAHTIEPWLLVATPAGARDAASARRLVERAAADPALEFASPVLRGSDGGPLIVTPTLMVGFRTEVNAARAEVLLAGAGEIRDRDWTGMRGVYRVRSPLRNGADVLAKANALAELAEVKFAEPDMIFTGRGSGIPNDPSFGSLWGLHNTAQFGGVADMDMDAPEAWDITMGDPAILVVIIDTGVDRFHPDINQVPGIDLTGQSGFGGPVNACDNHGTTVAGCVSASANNAIGIAGIAPGCKSASARTFISNLTCDLSWGSASSWTVDALAWAEFIGARVTNNSNFYGGLASAAIDSKYEQTWNAGMVHFACASNFSQPQLSYPAIIPVVNAVAALDPFGNRAGFSNWGEGLDFSAPGQWILTTDRSGAPGWINGDYVFVDGTSFASPYSAGIAALLLSHRPNLSAFEVESVMQASCRDLGVPGYETDFGWGFVNARDALLSLPDCNDNNLDDACELDCGLAGCNVPGCGLGYDCNENFRPDDCDLAQAVSVDCNVNAVPDECDLDGGTSPDCNGSETPDECELVANDCDANSVPDECDETALAGTISAPLDAITCADSSASFSVSAAGATGYQWYRDGVTPLTNGGAISGANSATLQIDPVSAADDGATYHCVVSFGCLSAPSAASTLEVPADELDVELVTPEHFTGCTAGMVLVVQVTASDPLTATYQWSKDGDELVDDGRITGAQTRTLEIDPTTGADSGLYTCVVGNSCVPPGGEVSTTGVVEFVDPYFTRSPHNTCAEVGASALFRAEAEGVSPFIYRWYEGAAVLSDGAKFSGTTTDMLTVANIALSDNGRQFRLRAIVPSPFCSTYSTPATLTALPVGDCPPCPYGAGDMDADGDFDLHDVHAFVRCFGADVVVDEACTCANVTDADTVVDLSDWEALEALLSGPA